MAELLTDAEESEIASARWENGSRPSKAAHQKRFDKLMGRLCAAREENQDLREVISRYEETIRKYKAALMEVKGRCKMAS